MPWNESRRPLALVHLYPDGAYNDPLLISRRLLRGCEARVCLAPGRETLARAASPIIPDQQKIHATLSSAPGNCGSPTRSGATSSCLFAKLLPDGA